MSKKKQGDTEIPKPENPEITPEVVPDSPNTPFVEPEIIPEDDPGGTSPSEIPVPDVETPDEPKPLQPQ